MTNQELQHAAAILQAALRGVPIEYQHNGRCYGPWHPLDVDDVVFNFRDTSYRIAEGVDSKVNICLNVEFLAGTDITQAITEAKQKALL